MSHDQKPGRMRVVGSGAANGASGQQRRRNDAASPLAPAGAQPPLPEAGKAGAGAVAQGAGVLDAASSPRAAGWMLPVVFVAGCAIGGAALTVVHPW